MPDVEFKTRLTSDKILAVLQKPDSLTTSGWFNINFHKYFTNKHLIPVKDGQLTSAKIGQGQWLFHLVESFQKNSF